MREMEREESKKLYEMMSDSDKKEYEDIMKQLQSKELSEDMINCLVERLEAIARKYA